MKNVDGIDTIINATAQVGQCCFFYLYRIRVVFSFDNVLIELLYALKELFTRECNI